MYFHYIFITVFLLYVTQNVFIFGFLTCSRVKPAWSWILKDNYFPAEALMMVWDLSENIDFLFVQ